MFVEIKRGFLFLISRNPVLFTGFDLVIQKVEHIFFVFDVGRLESKGFRFVNLGQSTLSFSDRGLEIFDYRAEEFLARIYR